MDIADTLGFTRKMFDQLHLSYLGKLGEAKFTYTPLISIVVPTYNTDPVFREMLESVKCQTYPNWELILIDDASPDKTVRTLSQEAAAEDSRVIHKALKKIDTLRARPTKVLRSQKESTFRCLITTISSILVHCLRSSSC